MLVLCALPSVHQQMSAPTSNELTAPSRTQVGANATNNRRPRKHITVITNLEPFSTDRKDRETIFLNKNF